MLPAALLADDFQTWMSAWTWKWVPERKKEVDLLLAAKFPLPTEERVALRVAKHGLSIKPTTRSTTPVSSHTRRQQFLDQLKKTPPMAKLLSKISTISSSPWDSPLQASQIPLKRPEVPFKTEYFEVKKSPNKGYSAFSTKNTREGTIIMSEAPLFRCLYNGVYHELERLTPDQRALYYTLAYFNDIAPWSKALAIYKTNRFETTNHLGGIFQKSSRFNHACHPYATCRYHYDDEKNELVVTACRDIKKGDEITISYTTAPANLPGDYGFYCDCPGCPPPANSKAIAEACR